MSVWRLCPKCECLFYHSKGKGPEKQFCSRKCEKAEEADQKRTLALAPGVFMPRESNTKVAQKMERAFAKEVGGVTVAGSGAPRGLGGDVETSKWLYELKTTRSDSSVTQRRRYILTTETLDKARRDAFRAGKKMAMGIHIEGHDVVVIAREDWKALSGEGED